MILSLFKQWRNHLVVVFTRLNYVCVWEHLPKFNLIVGLVQLIIIQCSVFHHGSRLARRSPPSTRQRQSIQLPRGTRPSQSTELLNHLVKLSFFVNCHVHVVLNNAAICSA